MVTSATVGPLFAYDEAGALIAVLRPAGDDGRWRPEKVLETAG